MLLDHFIIAGNRDHKILDGFKIRPDQTLDCGVSCPERLENPHRLLMGVML